MHPRHLLDLFVYSTSTNGLLLWYMTLCTLGLKVLIVLTRVNETNGYSDYDADAFIVTMIEKRPSYMRALAVRADVTRRS